MRILAGPGIFPGALNQDKPRLSAELQMCAFGLGLAPEGPKSHLRLGPVGRTVAFIFGARLLKRVKINVQKVNAIFSLWEFNHAMC